MFVSVRLCVIILVLFGALTAGQRQLVETQSRDIISGKHDKAHVNGNRLKRGLLNLGALAARKLLESAKFIYSNGFDSVYVKRGGIKRALKDFELVVDPNTVENLSTKSKNKIKKVGKFGDLTVTVNNERGTPVVTIAKRVNPNHNPGYADPESMDSIIVYKGEATNVLTIARKDKALPKRGLPFKKGEQIPLFRSWPLLKVKKTWIWQGRFHPFIQSYGNDTEDWDNGETPTNRQSKWTNGYIFNNI